jgi:hypothetical protein
MRVGLHAPVQGATERFIQTAEALQASVFLWLALTPGGPHRPADALRYPGGTHIVRVANPARYEDPAAWMARVVPALDPWVAAGIPPGALIVQHANEPDVAAIDLPAAWDLGVWMGSAHGYRDALKARYPNLPLLSPPFSCANTKYLTAEYVAPYEGVAVHCYWAAGNPGWRQGTDGGAAWRSAAPFGKPVWVTEANSNPTDAEEIVAWVREVDSPLVEGATLFVADGAQSWPEYDVTPETAAAVRAGLSVTPPKPPPSPPEPTPMADYLHFSPLSYAQYQAIIATGTIPGRTSPMLNEPDYHALIGVMQQAQIDPRLPLAFTWSEGHHGSDPGLVAAGVNNLGGIKYVGAPGTFDSGIPADTGGTYAGFYDLRPYYIEWVRIMNNDIIGPCFRAGDLICAVEHYTNGPGTGHNKVAKYEEYVSDYPASAVTPPATGGVSGDAIATEALTQRGQTWAGTYDTHNGNHPWYLWCQSFVERVHEHAGITGPFYASAADCGRAMEALGRLHRGDTNAPRGAVLFWDEQFWADGGHTAISLGDGTFVGTTDQGIQIRSGWQSSAGYMGWAFRPGVGDTAPHVEEVDEVKVGDGFAPDELRLMWYGTGKPTATAKKNFPYEPDKLGTHGAYGLLANGTFKTDEQDFTGLSVCLGRCLDKETGDPGTPGRSVIHFERGKLTALRQPDGSYLIRVN